MLKLFYKTRLSSSMHMLTEKEKKLLQIYSGEKKLMTN